MNKVIIFDLDNTLYNWLDAYVESLKYTVNYLCGKINKESNELLPEFKKVFLEYGSVEVPSAIAELKIWQELTISNARKKYLVNHANKIFKNEWRKNLKLFPSVVNVLDNLKDNDCKLIAYSDAYSYWVNFRLNTLGIKNYFDRIYAKSNEDINLNKFAKNKSHNAGIIDVPAECMKPNTDIVEKIINDYKIKKENVYFVGDNINKDIYCAQKIGVNDVWASYGLKYNKDNGKFLSKVTPWKKGIGYLPDKKFQITPTHTINSIDELLNIVPTESKTNDKWLETRS